MRFRLLAPLACELAALDCQSSLRSRYTVCCPPPAPAGQPFFLAEDKDDTIFSNSARAEAVRASLEAVKLLPSERERAAVASARRAATGTTHDPHHAE